MILGVPHDGVVATDGHRGPKAMRFALRRDQHTIERPGDVVRVEERVDVHLACVQVEGIRSYDDVTSGRVLINAAAKVTQISDGRGYRSEEGPGRVTDRGVHMHQSFQVIWQKSL